MRKQRSQFGIGLPHGDDDDEWDVLGRSKERSIVAHDNDEEVSVLLYGPKGEALVQLVPRPVGFRMEKR